MPVVVTPDNRVLVTYPACLHTKEITLAELQIVKDLEDRRVTAIKFIRAQHQLDLGNAKRLCDSIWETAPKIR